MNGMTEQTITEQKATDRTKNVLTFSALNTYRNCPCKYNLRYQKFLTRRERPEALAFGGVIHEAIETWYRPDPHGAKESIDVRTIRILNLIDKRFPNRHGDANEKKLWQLARAMMAGYCARYAEEEFIVVEVEKEFQAEIRNPDTGRTSQTFTMAGKVDGIVSVDCELYLLEHKTAASIDGNYLDKLWSDTQIALYSHYLRELGFPIVGVIYNVLLKTRLQQKMGETEDEYQIRLAEQCAKNKSGKSNAKRNEPETDGEFQSRLLNWYSQPEAFHRERIYLSAERMSMVQDEVWEITQQYLDAKKRGKWLLNTSQCFTYGRPCEFLPYCQSGFNENVRDNLFEVKPPHEELPSFTADAVSAVESF
jgi:hypothetical protein